MRNLLFVLTKFDFKFEFLFKMLLSFEFKRFWQLCDLNSNSMVYGICTIWIQIQNILAKMWHGTIALVFGRYGATSVFVLFSVASSVVVPPLWHYGAWTRVFLWFWSDLLVFCHFSSYFDPFWFFLVLSTKKPETWRKLHDTPHEWL